MKQRTTHLLVQYLVMLPSEAVLQCINSQAWYYSNNYLHFRAEARQSGF